MASRIHACDDEPHITLAVKMKLSKAGFEVKTTSDGQQALEAIQAQAPELLITDYQMPRMDGLELCRRLRSEPATSELPIILLTAKGFELDEEQIMDELKITKVLVKPFSPRELLQTVQELVGAAEVHS